MTAKTLFEKLKEQFLAGDGIVKLQFEVIALNDANLELKADGTIYSATGDRIVTIDAPAALTGNVDVVTDETAPATSAASQSPESPSTIGETIVEQVPAIDSGSVDVPAADVGAGEAATLANEPVTAAVEDAGIAVTGADGSEQAPVGEAGQGEVLGDVEIPASVKAAGTRYDNVTEEVLKFYGAVDLDPVGETNGATVYKLKNAEGEEIITGTISDLLHKARNGA